MKNYTDILEHKLHIIQSQLLSSDKSFSKYQKSLSASLPMIGGEMIFCVFLSICDRTCPAIIFRSAANSLENAWNETIAKAKKYVRTRSFNPVWIKVDIINDIEKVSFHQLQQQIDSYPDGFFRKGISFDATFQSALLEAELNAGRIIHKKELTLASANRYLSKHSLKTMIKMPENLYLFKCAQLFCDESDTVFPLCESDQNYGRRNLPEYITREQAAQIIADASDYLATQVNADGQFIYGIYADNGKTLKGYNILRHAGSVWELLSGYQITGDRFLMIQAGYAIQFMLKNLVTDPTPMENGEKALYFLDAEHNELKTGANALAVLALTEYAEITGDQGCIKTCIGLGNGILKMMDSKTGAFVHVFSYPDFTHKKDFQTIFYEGEAVFALCKLYGMTKEQKWLDAAKLAADRFIREDYTRYHDHWVSYSFNELTKYLPEKEYLAFGLRNIHVNLKRLKNAKAYAIVYLEMLCAAFEMYSRIEPESVQLLCSGFDTGEFIRTIFYRADYMLNGYAFPELTMYMQSPEKLNGAFLVRNDRFRIRIDDIQHFTLGYCSIYRQYDRMIALLKQTEN